MALENFEIYCEKYDWNTTPTYELSYHTFNLTEAVWLGNYYEISFNNYSSNWFINRQLQIKYKGEFGKRMYLARANLSSGNSCWLHMINEGQDYELVLAVTPAPTVQEVANEFNKYSFAFEATVLRNGTFATGRDTGYGGRYVDMQAPVYVEKTKVIPNFFSPDTKTLLETINVKDYLIDIGNLSYSFDNSDNEVKENSFYFEDCDVSFTTSGIENNNHLKSFFGINQDTTDIKYLVKIKKDGNLVFKGIVNQDSIEENFDTSSNSEQIKFQSLGMLKEFKNYYSNQPLTIPTTLQLNGEMLLTNLLSELFNSPEVNIIYDNDIAEYYVTLNGGLQKLNSTTTNFRLRKCGYERIVTNGENRWDFLRKLCNAMGWIFYSFNNNFYLRNRSTEIVTSTTLDYNDFIEYTALKTNPTFYDAIIIYDGQFFGGNDAGFGDIRRGTGLYIFTKIGDEAKNDIPFHQMTGSSGLGFAGGRWQKVYSSDDSSFTYQIVQDTNNGYGAVKYKLDKDNILFLDAGDTGQHGWVFDTSNGANWPCDSFEIGEGHIREYDVAYTGNYGGCLFKKGDKWQMYYDYAKSNAFANNFLKYSQDNASNKIKVRCIGIEINPLVKYTIINNSELEGEWTINSIEYDFKAEETSMELQKKLEEE